VPLKVVKQQYGGQATQETLSDLIQSTLGQAISQEKLNPAGYPQIDSTDLNDSGELSYTALFEVYPEIALADVSRLNVERVTSEVADADIDTMLETLRKQRAEWNEVDRAAAADDQVTVDFIGTIDGEEFAGGKGDNVALTLGSGQMIPGFEDQVIGMKAGDEKSIDVTFPADYGKEDLQNKAAKFAIKAHKVAEQILPEVDADFVKAFGVEDGDVAKLRENLTQHMQRELDQKVKAKSKTVVMDGLIEQNPIEVPISLVKQEVQRLKEQAFQQFGESAPIKLEDLPDDPFEEDAARRVKLGLLLGEIIKQQELKADAGKVKAMITQMASSYEQPEQVVNYYYENPQMLQSIESVVVEDQAVEWVLDQAKVTESKVAFDELMKEEAQ
jgi:trigger factor